MPQLALRAEIGTSAPFAGLQAGAVLTPGEWGTVVVTRVMKPPLRFKGRRLMQHWRDPFGGWRIFVELWQRQTGGFVVSHSLAMTSGAKTDGVRVKDLNAAMSHLEALCRSSSEDFVGSGCPADVWNELQRRVIFDQHFALLVGDALADWSETLTLEGRM